MVEGWIPNNGTKKSHLSQEKSAFRNLFTVIDCGLKKLDNIAMISVVFGTTLGTILRA